jgi:hypothetical protein
LFLLARLIRGTGLLLAIGDFAFLIATLALLIRDTSLLLTICILAFLVTASALLFGKTTFLVRTSLLLFLLTALGGLHLALGIFLLHCAILGKACLCGLAVLFLAHASDILLPGFASAAFGFLFECAGGFGTALFVCSCSSGELLALVPLLSVMTALLLLGEAETNVGRFLGLPAAPTRSNDAGGCDGGAADDSCVASECAVGRAGHGAAETTRTWFT